jgi:hypothetical protein
MARIHAFYLENPCSGRLHMVGYLAKDEISISRNQVRNRVRLMGFRAIYQKPLITITGHPSERFPWLVDLSLVTAAHQVRATDVTYIPLQNGFLFLIAVVDLFSMNVLSWKLSADLAQGTAWMAWRWRSLLVVSQRSSTPIKAPSSHLLTSRPGCSLRTRSAGQAENAATTISSWCDCGGQSSTRRCTCMPEAIAKKPRLADPSSYGGAVM